MIFDIFVPKIVEASIVEFTTSSVEGVLGYSGTLFTDLAPVILVIIGLPVAFWVIRKVIGVVRTR